MYLPIKSFTLFPEDTVAVGILRIVNLTYFHLETGVNYYHMAARNLIVCFHGSGNIVFYGFGLNRSD